MKSTVKIFVDAHVFDDEYQGTRTFIRGLYSVIAYENQFQLYFAAKNIENLKYELREICDFSNVHFLQLKSNNKFTRLLFEIPRLIKVNEIDFAHFQYIVPPIKNCKYIVTIHDLLFMDYKREFSLFYRLSKRFLFKYAALRSEFVTTVSNYSRDAIKKHFHINKPITVIPNGVSESYFKRVEKQISVQYIQEKYKMTHYLLYVSRFEPRKNHYCLLKSYLDLKLYEQDYHLVLLGHKSMGNPGFENLYNIQSDAIKQKIFIHDKITNEDLFHFYNGASLFVYPSIAEGFGIPPLEAGAVKTPVICSNTSAMNEFDFFEQNHIDPTNTELLKKRIKAYLEESERSHEKLNRISYLIREKYNWSNSASIFLSNIQ